MASHPLGLSQLPISSLWGAQVDGTLTLTLTLTLTRVDVGVKGPQIPQRRMVAPLGLQLSLVGVPRKARGSVHLAGVARAIPHVELHEPEIYLLAAGAAGGVSAANPAAVEMSVHGNLSTEKQCAE